MSRPQIVLSSILALLCGLAAGSLVYFVTADPPVRPSPVAVAPVAISVPTTTPSTVMLPMQRTQEPATSPTEPSPTVPTEPSPTEPTEPSPTEPTEPSPAASMSLPMQPAATNVEARVRRARVDCHAYADDLCNCHPSTCAAQRSAQVDADRQFLEAAHRMARLPGALDRMVRELKNSCRQTRASIRSSLVNCTR